MAEYRFQVDPDVTTARTLDKAFYLDEAMYRLARERVFASAWHWLGPLAEVQEPGTLAPHDLLPGLLDEPLLLARDAAGTLRCGSTSCSKLSCRRSLAATMRVAPIWMISSPALGSRPVVSVSNTV